MITRTEFESFSYDQKHSLIAGELTSLAPMGWVLSDLKKSFEIAEHHSEAVLDSYYAIIVRYYSIARDDMFDQRHEKEMQLQKKIAEQESQEKNDIILNI